MRYLSLSVILSLKEAKYQRIIINAIAKPSKVFSQAHDDDGDGEDALLSKEL